MEALETERVKVAKRARRVMTYHMLKENNIPFLEEIVRQRRAR